MSKAGLYLLGILSLLFTIWGIRQLLNRPVDTTKIIQGMVDYGRLENSITAGGVVKPLSVLTLTSPLNTRIQANKKENGSFVKPGETIMTLDTEFAELELDRLEDELDLKDNNVVRMKLELEKNIRDIELDDKVKDLQVKNLEALLADAKRLLEIGGATQEEVDKAGQNLAIARLEKKKLENELGYRKASIGSDVLNEKIQSSIQRKRLSEVKKKIDLANLTSPVEGVITWMNKNIGNQVAEGDPLARIANLNSYSIEGQVADMHAGKIKVGLPIQVRLAKTVLKGRIEQILPAVENNTIQFRIALDQPKSQSLRPNMEVDVRIITDTKERGLYLPNGPAIKGGKLQTLFVIEGNKAVAHEVTIGMRTTERVEIVSGLEPGDQVILSDMSQYEKRPKIRLK